MNKEMQEYIENTPIEDIIYRDDFVQLKIEYSRKDSKKYWIVTLEAKPINTNIAASYTTAWGELIQSRYYIFYKEVSNE